MMKLRHFLVTFAILQGCAFSGDPLRNPELFLFSKWDGDLTGEYNPTGFHSSDVKNHVASVCRNEEIINYIEEENQNGLVKFSATCAISRFGESAEYEVKKTALGLSVTQIPSITLP